MPVSVTDQQCPNRNIYISEIRILLKTNSQKLGYILTKLVTLVNTLNCNISKIYKHKKLETSIIYAPLAQGFKIIVEREAEGGGGAIFNYGVVNP